MDSASKGRKTNRQPKFCRASIKEVENEINFLSDWKFPKK
jgi:hypothetical protein